MRTSIDEFRRSLLEAEAKPAPSGLARLWRTGQSAAGMAAAVVGGKFRGRGEGLEAADLEAIVRVVKRLGELKGVAMKAGQLLGYIDPSLSPELRGIFSVLQTSSPASSFVEVKRVIQEALGLRADALLANLSPVPIAVASIGQVHRGRLPDGREVAVKVLHPGIEAALQSDFKAAHAGSAIAAAFFGAAGAVVTSFVQEAQAAILEESDLQLEARRQEEFARLFAADSDVVIPPVLPDWCGPGVLTAGFRPGQGLDAWLARDPSPMARNRVGEALFRFYVATLYRHGLFHADPHPGNYAIQDDGRVVIYDFGCVRRFDRTIVEAFAKLVVAVRDDDAASMCAALQGLGAEPRPTMNEGLRALLRGFFGPVLCAGVRRIEPDRGIDTRRALQDKRTIMKLGLPGKLLFLFRLRFGLYSVLSSIRAEADWCGLESGWASEVLPGQAQAANVIRRSESR